MECLQDAAHREQGGKGLSTFPGCIDAGQGGQPTTRGNFYAWEHDRLRKIDGEPLLRLEQGVGSHQRTHLKGVNGK